MPMVSYQHIFNRAETKTETIEQLARTDEEQQKNHPSFMATFSCSNKVMINFDALAKEIGSTISSPDALTMHDKTIYFIEFKNRKWSDIPIPELFRKLYDGISTFAYHSNHIQLNQNISFHFIIICNPEKNLDSNPFSQTMATNLAQSGNSITDDDRTKHRIKHLRLLSQALSKYHINININVYLSTGTINNFFF